MNRNDPCPCESGKKYKRCCGSPQAKARRQEARAAHEVAWDGVLELKAAMGGDFGFEEPRESYFDEPIRVMLGVAIGLSAAIILIAALAAG